MDHILEQRRLFARQITASAGIPPGSELEAAFASTPREQFVAPPPWRVITQAGEVEGASDDLAHIYQDIVVSLGSSQGSLNNGQPSLHALCIQALGLRKGERVLHIGAGTGYYTTILARLVGDDGSVLAYEIDPELARRATGNLASLPQVVVQARSGAVGPLPACDAIYVNAGAIEPLAVWLDAFKPGGRLLFPLTGSDGTGAMLLVTRREDDAFAASFLTTAAFVPCVGARDEATAEQLTRAFGEGDMDEVRSLHRNGTPDDSCWCAGEGWWLSTR